MVNEMAVTNTTFSINYPMMKICIERDDSSVSIWNYCYNLSNVVSVGHSDGSRFVGLSFVNEGEVSLEFESPEKAFRFFSEISG